ncbi:two-component system regulatory protein YycI [Peribacillus frigoritolerans]|uniref:two-component system regulatory protein YycI n=1 Tax=Peribacillus frigoritolerans TaxID=450367 RepID=UPI002225E31F|nr:two-component system regulatory protein YycI [Peribacillus frigoritolerans]UYY99014.1 two-component system regulatory protein YycI [Peribacillus frigoritolerans]
MDWNNTKSIFIMVFFVLNIFLLYQFLEKINDSQYESFTESTTEELLKEDEISIETQLPKQKLKDQFLIAQSKTFEKKDIQHLKNQNAKIIDDKKLVGTFKTPVGMKSEIHAADLDIFLKEYILNGNEYHFWSYDEISQTIICYQVADKKMFFNNSKGKVTLYLNKKGEIVSYEQMYLEGIKKFNKPKELESAITAIGALYDNGDIDPKSKVTNVKLGYYNSLQTTSVSHLLVPTWWVVIDDETDLFVNAFDKEVIELNTEEKILE